MADTATMTAADAAAATAAAHPAPIRGCDGCTLCCKVMAVPTLAKPSGTWCQHCTTGTGCGIYEARPGECRAFVCGYLWIPDIAPEWKPALSRLIISSEMGQGAITIFVDPARPDAWRRQPYYAGLQAWARRELPRGRRVEVRIGTRSIVIMPDHAVDLGPMAPDELVLVLSRAGASDGQVYAVRRDVWDKASAEVGQGRTPPITDGFRPGRRLD